MNLIKKTIGISVFVISCFASSPARAADWVYIGNIRGIDYYVDTDRDVARGYFWTAPIRGVDRNRTNRNYLGQAAINCRNYTVKIQIDNSVNNWSRINRNTPMDFVGKKVCF